MKNYLFVLSILLLFNKTKAQTENLYVVLTSGPVLSYTLNEIRKIDFSNEQLRLHQTDGLVYSWDFGDFNYYTYQQPLGISAIKVSKEKIIELFPNPTDGFLKLKYLFPSTELLTVQIYNLSGKLLKEEQIRVSVNDIYTIDVSKINNGQYICKIQSSSFQISKSFIKN